MESRIKHLEMIQVVIIRLASNSFVLRGWAITLTTGILALTNSVSDNDYYLIAFLPILTFWMLDGYFMSRERRYRSLYDHIRNIPEKKIDFTMDSRPFKKGKNTWLKSCLSTVLLTFYGSLLLTVIGITIVLRASM